MKEIDMNFKIDDLEIPEDASFKTAPEIFIHYLETGISSSFSDEKKVITEEERRKVYRLMNRLDEHVNGKISLSDKSYAFMQERWKAKKMTSVTLTSNFRKIFMRMDAIIVPDEIKEYKDVDEPESTEQKKE